MHVKWYVYLYLLETYGIIEKASYPSPTFTLFIYPLVPVRVKVDRRTTADLFALKVKTVL
jgi:hypothetical protein